MFQDRNAGNFPDSYAYKTADQVVSASTLLADDDDLAVSVRAGKKYAFRVVIHADQNVSAPGLDIQFTGPASAYFYAEAYVGMSASVAPQGPITALSQELVLAPDDTTFMVIIEGAIEPSATGTLTLQWAQNTAADTTTILKGSSFMAWRMV